MFGYNAFMTTTLDQIRRPIEGNIEEFNAFVRNNFSREQGTLIGDMLEYVLSARGKGLRPVVVMLAAGANSATGNFGKRTMLAAMLVEMIHVASLIHDDVIDESNLRRGKPSVNAMWQSRNAVLVGDYTLEFLRKIHADVAVFSVQAVSRNGEFYDCYADEVAIRNVMIKNAKKRILLCDSSKLDKTSTFYQAHTNDIEHVISDTDLSTFFTDPTPEKYILA